MHFVLRQVVLFLGRRGYVAGETKMCKSMLPATESIVQRKQEQDKKSKILAESDFCVRNKKLMQRSSYGDRKLW